MCTSDKVLQSYIEASAGANLEPHVYALAKNAYAALDTGMFNMLLYDDTLVIYI